MKYFIIGRIDKLPLTINSKSWKKFLRVKIIVNIKKENEKLIKNSLKRYFVLNFIKFIVK
ncbi:MAG: hypothetical protein N2589_07075 [bacterium]|nr:hypothetical protein [bacterium]